MNFDPVFSIPLIATLAGVGVVLALIRAATGRSMRPAWLQFPAFVFRVAALGLLALFLLNPSTPVNVTVPDSRAVVLVDESASMSLGTRWQDASAWTAEVLAGLKKDGLPAPGMFVFSSAVDAVNDPATLAAMTPSGAETNLSRALDRVLSATGALPPDHIVVVSDGRAHDRATLPAALAAARAKGVGISTHAVGTDTPPRNAWIAAVQAPRSVRSMSKLAVHVDVESSGVAAGETLSLSMKDESGAIVASADLRATADGKPVEAVLHVESGLRGMRYALELSVSGREVTMDDNRFDFSVDVATSKLRVLFVEGTHVKRTVGTTGYWWNDMELMTRAWDATGEIEYQCLTPISEFLNSPNLVGVSFANGEMIPDRTKDFPKTREELYRYDVMLISDVPVGNFSAEQMQWVVDWVTERGGGFLMGGGYTTFDAGNYDKTPWEKITPVDMLLAGDGFNEQRFKIEIPKSVRSHPTWRLVPDVAKNEEILATHPDFTGMNRVRRAKPGAVVLMTRPDMNNEPVIAAQQYGRGRSIAYLGDPNGGWAKYLVSWGPPGGPPHGPHTELGHGDRFKVNLAATKSASGPPPPHPSPYYALYWTNVVKWLGENSIRWHRDKLAGRIAAAQAQPGKDLPVAAEVLAVASRDALLALDVGARLDRAGSPRVRLEYDRDKREFVGAVPIPAELAGTETAIVFDAVANGEPFTDSVKVGLRRENREFTDYKPDRAFLAELAQAGGGVAAESAADAVKACRDAATQRAQTAGKTWNRPDWPKWPWWSALVAVLCAEWAVRRYGSRALVAALCIFCVPAMAETPEEIAALIEQLGAPRVRLRDEAEEKLKAIPDALESVKAATKSSPSEEVRLRARNVAQMLIQNVWQEEIVVSDGHRATDAGVRAIVVSSDGSRFFTRGMDFARAWDAETMKPGISFGEACSISGWPRTGPISTLALSPDGKRAIVTNDRGVLTIHDTDSGAVVATLTPPPPMRTVNSIVNGVATPVQIMGAGQPQWGAAYFADGKRVVSCDRSGTVRLWDCETGGILKSVDAMTGQVCRTLAISRDEKFVAVSVDYGGEPDFLWILNVESFEWVGKETLPNRLNTLRFSKDGRTLLASCAAGFIATWSFDGEGSLGTMRTIGRLGGKVTHAEYSADEKTVFACGESTDGQIVEFDVNTGEEVWRSTHFEKSVEEIAVLSKDRIITVSNDDKVRLWQRRGSGAKPLTKQAPEKPAATPQPAWVIEKQASGQIDNPFGLRRSMIITPDGKGLFTRHQKAIQKWSVETLVRGDTFGADASTWTDWRSNGSIFALSISRDGKRVVSTNDAGTLFVHDSMTLAELASLKSSSPDSEYKTVWQAEFLNDGTQVAAVGRFGTLQIWDIAASAIVANVAFNGTGLARAMAVSPDSETIAVYIQNTGRFVVYGFSVAQKRWTQAVSVSAGVSTLRFSRDGKTLLAGCYDGVARLLPVSDTGTFGSQKVVGHPTSGAEECPGAAYSFDEKTVFIVLNNGEITEYDIATGKELWRSENLGAPQDGIVVLGPDRIATYGRNDRLRIWKKPSTPAGAEPAVESPKPETPKPEKQAMWRLEKQASGQVANPLDSPRSIVASLDRVRLFTRHQEYLQAWNTETLERGITFGAKSVMWTDWRRSGPVLTLAISPDGKHVVTTDDDGTIFIHASDTGMEEMSFENLGADGNTAGSLDKRTVWQAAYFPDGKRLVTSDFGGNVRVWDTATGKQSFVLQGESWGLTRAVAVSPGGKHFAVGLKATNYGAIMIGDVESGGWMQKIAAPVGQHTLAYNRAGTLLMGAGYNGVLYVWPVNAGGQLGKETAIGTATEFSNLCAVFSANEKSAIVGSLSGEIIQYDISAGKEIWRSENLGAPQDGIVVLAPDRIATYGRNDRLRIWKFTSPTQAPTEPK